MFIELYVLKMLVFLCYEAFWIDSSPMPVSLIIEYRMV